MDDDGGRRSVGGDFRFAEIVWGIRVSYKIEGVFALARVVTYPQTMCLSTLFIGIKPDVVLGEQVT